VRGEGSGRLRAVYPVLKAMEEPGQVRRGYFVAGLGGAQFAAPRRRRPAPRPPRGTAWTASRPTCVVLAATDPAQPYGAALAWPPTAGRPARAAGAHVVLVDGAPLSSSGAAAASSPSRRRADDAGCPALAGAGRPGRLRKLEITKVDGRPVHDTAWATTAARGTGSSTVPAGSLLPAASGCRRRRPDRSGRQEMLGLPALMGPYGCRRNPNTERTTEWRTVLSCTSKVKEAVKGLDLRMSGDVPDALNEKVSEMLKDAAKRAKENGRGTLRPYDL
jgi:hypothetical protein